MLKTKPLTLLVVVCVASGFGGMSCVYLWNIIFFLQFFKVATAAAAPAVVVAAVEYLLYFDTESIMECCS